MKKALLILVCLPIASLAQQGWFWLNPLPQGNSLQAVQMFSATEVYALAGNANLLLKTTNAGTTWTTVPITPVPVGGYFQAMHFTGKDSGVVVGYGSGFNGAIARTTNGGATWTTTSSSTIPWLYAVTFTTPTRGFAVGDYYVLMTTNAGATWDTLQLPNGPRLQAVDFSDQNTGYAAGDGGVIFKKTNGGTSWINVYISRTPTF